MARRRPLRGAHPARRMPDALRSIRRRPAAPRATGRRGPTRRGPLPALALLALAAACGGGAEPAADPEPPSAIGLYRVGDVQDPARPTYHDFGEVPAGTPLEHTFEFANGGASPVRILRMASSCSCTIPGLEARLPDGTVIQGDPYDPERLLEVPPGAVARITLRVDPDAVRQANRDKLVTVRLTTDSPATPYLSLEAHLVVREHFQIAPAEADFGRVPSSVGAATVITLMRVGEARHTIGALLEVPEGVRARLDPFSAGADGVWELEVEIAPEREPGVVSGAIEIESFDAQGEPAATLVVPVRALVVPDVGVMPPMFSLRPYLDGVGHEVQLVSRVRERPVVVEQARILGPLAERLELSVEPTDPDPLGRAVSWTLRLTGPAPGPDETLPDDVVEVLLDDPRHPRLEIPITTAALR